ncbi:hypothetical protein HY419_01195, partial [candidate division WWE3 bacterium]|nr:hypothetical protein [candidate division WWE3 bacterium]
IDFLSYEKEISADSLRSIEEFPISTDGVRPLRRYTEIFRNGYVESGVGPEIMWPHSKLGLMFNISWFTASFWQFIKFCRALYERIGYIDEVSLLVALADIENITLHGFGKKDEKTNWLDPYNFRYSSKMPICKQKNVRIERNIIASELSDPNIEGIVKDISKRVSNAFGESIAKCFDDQGNFDREQLHGFRNVH